MAETDTPVLDRKPDTGQPGPPPGPPEGGGSGGFGSLAEAVYSQRQSAAQVERGLKEKAERLEPVLKDTEESIRAGLEGVGAQGARVEQAAAGVRGLPPAPSLKLTEFLAPVDGESPITSITKLIQALGLFATGASGAAKGDARAGLAAFTGAMVGWQAGDKERADRHFADWRAKTETALTKWQTERQTYHDVLAAANITMGQRMNLAHLIALREDNKNAAAAFATGEWDKGVAFIERQDKAARDTDQFTKSLAQSKDIADTHAKIERERIAAQERATQAHLEDVRQRREEMLALPTPGRFYDAEAGEIRTISKKELMGDLATASGGGKQRFREMKPAEAQLVERVAIGFPILDRLEQLMDKIQVAAKGENITQGLINRLKAKSGISEDLKEFTTLKLDQALEQAAAMSGGMPRIAILKMLRGEASPTESETIGVGKRAIETTRTTLKNRITQSTGDTEAWKKLSKNLEQYVPKGGAGDEGWKIELVK